MWCSVGVRLMGRERSSGDPTPPGPAAGPGPEPSPAPAQPLPVLPVAAPLLPAVDDGTRSGGGAALRYSPEPGPGPAPELDRLGERLRGPPGLLGPREQGAVPGAVSTGASDPSSPSASVG